MSLAALIALAVMQPAASPGAVLVARAVGPAEWRIESSPGGTTLRNIRLAEGQTIILIDAKGTREVKGPGELLVLSKGLAEGKPLFALAFRALTTPASATLKAGVRGAGEAPATEKAGWEQLQPRD
ncbi:MAG: hypothetical protein JSS55_16785 [Proteobacteria bacterium]|nr:hypothetical protein [Pseudomonadota bacterium]